MGKIRWKDADDVARIVLTCANETLAMAQSEHDRLVAFAYADRSLEQWFVAEVYIRLLKRWKDIESVRAAITDSRTWRSWMEVLKPEQETARQHIDLLVGPHEHFKKAQENQYGDYYDQPTEDAPVFEFKVVRDDNWSAGVFGFSEDQMKLEKAKLVNGFVVVLFMVSDPKRLDEGIPGHLPLDSKVHRFPVPVDARAPWGDPLNKSIFAVAMYRVTSPQE